MNTPFIVTPPKIELITVGNEQTGQMTLLKLGYITVAEQMELDDNWTATQELQIAATRLIAKLCKELSISATLATEVISFPLENAELAGNYIDEIEDVLYNQGAINPKIIIKEVHTAIRWRALRQEDIKALQSLIDENDWSVAQRFCNQRQIWEDWQIADTEALPMELFNQIRGFYASERVKKLILDPLPLEKDLISSKDSIGKESPTGKKSTGKSKDQG